MRHFKLLGFELFSEFLRGASGFKQTAGTDFHHDADQHACEDEIVLMPEIMLPALALQSAAQPAGKTSPARRSRMKARGVRGRSGHAVTSGRLLCFGGNLHRGRHSGNERDIFGILVDMDADWDALREPYPGKDWVHLRKPRCIAYALT